MYVELFLLDNALMDMLICRLAAALCARRLSMRRTLLMSLVGAAYSLAAFLQPMLMTLPLKIALCLAMGLALPFKGARGYVAGALAMFVSACIIGGLAFFMACATGGAAKGGIASGDMTLRLLLIIASAAAAMPSVIRRFRTGAVAAEGINELRLWINGREYALQAMVDSGNTLMEPISGLPAAVVYLPECEDLAGITLPAETVGGEQMLSALRPDRAVYGDEELDILIAFSTCPVYPGALIPPGALPGSWKEKTGIKHRRYHRVLEAIRRILYRIYVGLGGSVHYINSGEALPPPLSKDEEAALMEALINGNDEVKTTLIERNLRLVVYIARKFENTGISVEDLVSIGTIGLIKAVNTFDAGKKIKLATYASRCIENEILMYLRRSCKLKLEVSLDEPLNVDWDGNELLLSDILGTDADVIYRDIEDEVDRELLRLALKKLTPREKQIMELRFGLAGKGEYTQKQVADMLGISQSYISRLEKHIIRVLRQEMIQMQ